MTKKIAVYGVYRAKVPVGDSFWDIIEEGAWGKLLQDSDETEWWEMRGRFEFSGTGKDLMKAVKLAFSRVPKGYIDVSAEEFLENPEKYSYEGVWVDREIESG